MPLLSREAVSAFRVNPLKESQLSFADAIPHTLGTLWWGLREVTRARDRSRLFARACSPNGGPDSSTKTWYEGLGLGNTRGNPLLAAYLANQGVLVSNEISSKRAKILVENMERFGATKTLS